LKKLLSKKIILAAMAVTMIIAILLPMAVFADNQSPVGVQGTLKFQGSTTVGPIIVNAVTGYNSYRGTSVIATGDIIQNGSGPGKAAMVAHQTDIGMASSKTNPAESTLNYITVARDGMVFIVNSSVTNITTLTKADILGIYNGSKTNWNQLVDAATGLAGPNLTIVPRARIIGSGTRAAWKDTVGFSLLSPDNDPTSGSKADYGILANGITTWAENWVCSPYANNGLERLPENVDMQAAINSPTATGQCGYVGLGFDTGANIKQISIRTAAYGTAGTVYAPTGINIYSGVYPFARFLYVLTANDWTPANKTTDVDNFITWLKATDGAGQTAVATTGFLKLVPNQDVDGNNSVNVLDLISVGNKVGASSNLGRSDVDRNGSVNVLDLISVGNWVGVSIVPAS